MGKKLPRFFATLPVGINLFSSQAHTTIRTQKNKKVKNTYRVAHNAYGESWADMPDMAWLPQRRGRPYSTIRGDGTAVYAKTQSQSPF